MKRKMALFAGFQMLLGAVGTAVAESGAGHHEAATISSLGWPAFNFIVYVSLMFFALRGPLGRALAARQDAVRGAVQRGSDRKAEAQKILAEAQTQTRSLEGDIEQLTKKIESETKSEVAAIATAAKSRSERILNQAREGAIAEQKATESLLKQELAQMVLKLAKEKLERGVTAESDKALRARALKNVAGMKLN